MAASFDSSPFPRTMGSFGEEIKYGVAKGVNFMERALNVDLDRDGDIGVINTPHDDLGPGKIEVVLRRRDFILEVTIVRGESLSMHQAEMLGRKDPYCVLILGNAKKRTQSVKFGGSDPVWNDGEGQTFEFEIRELVVAVEEGADADVSMLIKVYGQDAIRSSRVDQLIGTIQISLREILSDNYDEARFMGRWYELEPVHVTSSDIQTVFDRLNTQATVRQASHTHISIACPPCHKQPILTSGP